MTTVNSADLKSPAETVHSDFATPTSTALRSCDQVLFYVELREVARSSEVFRNMLDAARPNASDTLDVIDVSEPASVIESILKLALGLVAPAFSSRSLSDVEPVYAAARKYIMAGPEQMLRSLIELLAMRLDDPLERLVAASNNHLDQLRDQAFDLCIGVEVDIDRMCTIKDNKLIGRLLSIRKDRTQALAELIISGKNVSEGVCGSCKTAQLLRADCSLMLAKFQCAALRVIMSRPSLEAVWADPIARGALNHLQIWQCSGSNCRNYPFFDLQERFEKAFEKKKK